MKENPRDSLDKLLTLIRKFSEIEIKRQKSIVTGKFGLGVQNEAGQRVLQREHTGHIKHPLQTTQKKTLHMNITRWSTMKSD